MAGSVCKSPRAVRRGWTAVVVASAAAATPILARGADRYFVGPTGGTWNNSANWSATPTGAGGAGVPAAGAIAHVTRAGSLSVTFDGNYAPGGGLQGLMLDGGVAGGSTVNIFQTSSASHLLADSEDVAVSGAALYAQSGGSNTTAFLTLGFNLGANGIYGLSGSSSSLTVSGVAEIGNLGRGTLTQSGGASSFATLDVAQPNGPAGSGVYNLSGGTLAAGYVAVAPAGTINMTGGSVSIGSGGGIDIDGTIDFSGSSGGTGSIAAPSGAILDFGHGSFLDASRLAISGSPNTLIIFPTGFNPTTGLASYSNPGVTAFADSPISIPGGKSIIGRASIPEHVNVSGSLSGGAQNSGAELFGGITVTGAGAAAAISTLTVEDATSGVGEGGRLDVNSFIYIGRGESGTFTHAGGTCTSGYDLYLGYASGAAGTYLLSGAGPELDVGGAEYVGFNGSGTFAQSGGATHTIAGGLYIAANPGSAGRFTISGGTLATPLMMNNGTFAQSGGSASVGAVGGGGDMSVSAGTLAADSIRQNSLSVGGAVSINANGGNDGTSVLSALTIAGATDAWTGRLDLNDNDVVLHSSSASRLDDVARITNQLKQGLNASGNSNSAQFWTGNGIVTSLGWKGENGNYTGLGVICNDFATIGMPAGPIYTLFDGETVGVNDVLMKYTYFGDADLDGAVTSNDYFRIDEGFLAGESGWINGDFDYDGTITSNDYFLIDNAFLSQRASLAPAAVLVPEPAGSAVVGVLAVVAAIEGLWGSRSRKRRR